MAPPAVAPPTADDIVKGLAEALKAQPAAPAAAAAAEPEQAPLYTAEEQAVLAEYQKNWPDVAKAEQLQRRVEYHDMLKFTFSEVAKYVAPLFEQVRAMGNTLHVGELKAAVPDYTEQLEGEVTKWIGDQPGYLQTAMKQVMQTGTSDEVADLIGRYRAATGVEPAPAAPAAIAAAALVPGKLPTSPGKTELSRAAKQAAASLAPVSGERSAVPKPEDDPQDFESSFKKFAAAEGST